MSQKDKLTFQKQEKIELPILTHTKTFDHAALDIEKKQTLYISPSCTNRYAHNY